jgi:hypothetical protein
MSGGKIVAPTDLRDYLKLQGWSVLEAALKDRLYVLENANFPRRQLVYPMDMTAPDYRESLDRVFDKLGDITGQKLEKLVSRVQALKDDVLRLRVSFDGNDSSLPLGFAATLVQNTEKLLKATACTVLRPRMHHPRLSLTEANQFVEKARFQQTENGSFVLKVACPVHSMEIQGSLDMDDADAPFVRQVTLALQSSLFKLTSAIEADTLDTLVSSLKSETSPLISSNLCEAISAMHDEMVDNSLDVGFDWSAMYAVPQSVSQRTIRIQRDYFSRIEEVRRELRMQEQDEEESFIGTVERLDGVIDESGRRSGDIILALLLPDEGETVRSKVSLSADDYSRADTAHMTNGAYVRVTGRLRPGRQPRQLTDVSYFELIARDQRSELGS